MAKGILDWRARAGRLGLRPPSRRAGRSRRAPSAQRAPRPDAGQLLGVTLLLALCFAPLLLELEPQIGLFIGAIFFLRLLCVRWPTLQPGAWHTDGRRWTPAKPDEFEDGETLVHPIGEAISYTVALERTDQRWLISLDLPTQIPSDARLTGDFQVVAARAVDDLRFYRMRSALNYRTEGLSLFEEAAATALPNNITPRMRALVADWREDGASPEQVVQRALNHFNQQEFYYTLLPPDLGPNPMDAFLFDARSGFCEHYAGSFALLMRIAGIPTRIVLGYLGGEYNPLSDGYLIRQSDAHAWNEVWLQERGWVRVDPTAYVNPARVDADSRLRAMGAGAPVRFRIDDQGVIGGLFYQAHLLADALNSGWRQWVVGFSRNKQQRLLEALGLGHLREYGLVLLMTIAGTSLMLLWSLALSQRPRQRDPVIRAYAQFLRKLTPLGLGRRADWKVGAPRGSYGDNLS